MNKRRIGTTRKRMISRFAAIVKHIVWLKKDVMDILRSYGIAPPPNIDDEPSEMPYLPGFEKMFLRAV